MRQTRGGAPKRYTNRTQFTVVLDEHEMEQVRDLAAKYDLRVNDLARGALLYAVRFGLPTAGRV
jgi:hypothetical protein